MRRALEIAHASRIPVGDNVDRSKKRKICCIALSYDSSFTLILGFIDHMKLAPSPTLPVGFVDSMHGAEINVPQCLYFLSWQSKPRGRSNPGQRNEPSKSRRSTDLIKGGNK